VFFGNGLGPTLTFNFLNSSASSNKLTAGAGASGGNAGMLGHNNILGGAGGEGGNASGGALFIMADASSVNVVSLSVDSFNNNVLTAGNGGAGGAGASSATSPDVGTFAAGGAGGSVAGGGVFNSSLNSSTNGSLTILSTTMAGNQEVAGNGANASTGTTGNGGPGGNGGNGGNAQGAGLYEGDGSSLVVLNSTFGGGVAGNKATAGAGGNASNAGTPSEVTNNNGGNGGTAGNASGGGAYIHSGTATFINDTIAANSVKAGAFAGFGGSPAGNGGGLPGQPGTAGAGAGGGIFSAAGTLSLGNTIVDLNLASDAAGNDTGGSSTSLGHNIFGTHSGVTTASGDQLGITQGRLLLSNLGNHGGPTLTDAPIAGSVAINKGDNSLLNLAVVPPGAFTFDQRGKAFNRIVGGTVDVGAVE
jgi:hypothetical protein